MIISVAQSMMSMFDWTLNTLCISMFTLARVNDLFPI